MEQPTDQTPESQEPFAPIESITGLTLALAGAAALVAGIIRRSRLLRVLGILLALAGGGFFARRKLDERGKKIDAAESEIRSQLDDLDPVARAQVITDITREQL
jgi:hypothetical protein